MFEFVFTEYEAKKTTHLKSVSVLLPPEAFSFCYTNPPRSRVTTSLSHSTEVELRSATTWGKKPQKTCTWSSRKNRSMITSGIRLCSRESNVRAAWWWTMGGRWWSRQDKGPTSWTRTATCGLVGAVNEVDIMASVSWNLASPCDQYIYIYIYTVSL